MALENSFPSKDYGDREVYRQRRRRPYVADDQGATRPRAPREETRELVPGLGNGYRWYDYVYFPVHWILSGPRTKFVPKFVRRQLYHLEFQLQMLNEHDRDRAFARDDWMEGFSVAAGEHVTVAGIWAVDLFPPDYLPSLEKSIRKNNWASPRHFAHEDNSVTLTRARAGGGNIWWRLANVARKKSRYMTFDASLEDLPKEIEFVQVRAIQVGNGLTAVAAFFDMSEAAESGLDAVWHGNHEPFLERPPGLPLQARSRQVAALRAVQRERARVHKVARSWLTAHLPGYFADHGEPQPLVELMLFEKYDPTSAPDSAMASPSQPPSNSELPGAPSADAKKDDGEGEDRGERVRTHTQFRALGIDVRELYHITSKSFPGLILSPVPRAYESAALEAPSWALWGRTSTVVDAVGGDDALKMYGRSRPERAIARRFDDGLYWMITTLSLSALLDSLEKHYAEVRDGAIINHGRFRIRSLVSLRRIFLTSSIRVISLKNDITKFYKYSRRYAEYDNLEIGLAPLYVAQDTADGRAVEPVRDYSRDLEKDQLRRVKALIAVDAQYRDVLGTVASLGSSVNASRIGLVALWVAVASFVASLGALLTAEVVSRAIGTLAGWAAGILGLG